MKNGLALVVGNIDYPLPHLKLNNAVNDARAVSRKLQKLGFIVQSSYDCSITDFDRSVKTFGERLENFGIGLFYYAGHGVQVEGKNYLTGTDTAFTDESSLKYSAMDLDRVIKQMQISSVEVKIIVLDACRNDPWSGSRSIVSPGLAPIHAPTGTIIAFSTSPGERAADSGPGGNSIYTAAFLDHIDDPNIPIEEFFKRVRTTVFTHSKGKQTSWEHTSLIGNYYFNSGRMLHSAKLSYINEHVADALFSSSGSEVDEIIVEMRSKNFHTQASGLGKFRSLKGLKIGNSEMFLIGRSLLRMAVGGEFKAERIFQKNLSSFLREHFDGEENHLLNGVLFEIYFNSNGLFRENSFTGKFIEEILELRKNAIFKKPFDFINAQIDAFKSQMYYMPTIPVKTIPIEIGVSPYKGKDFDNRRRNWQLESVKWNNEELFTIQFDEAIGSQSNQFVTLIAEKLYAPRSQVRVTWNYDIRPSDTIVHPWEFKLARQQRD